MHKIFYIICVFSFVNAQVSNAETGCEIFLRLSIRIAELRPDGG